MNIKPLYACFVMVISLASVSSIASERLKLVCAASAVYFSVHSAVQSVRGAVASKQQPLPFSASQPVRIRWTQQPSPKYTKAEQLMLSSLH